ncbi:hypothetical protein [Xanthobacter autotrophicus]|uniref:hypothetical protein n=1 Tax=Xanthobacter autotrophicus TaxID=280 RepID=UPI0037278FF3
MPKPTAAANATPMPATTRRAFLKAGDALGTVAALAVPVAILPKAEAAEHPDADLLRLGAEFERNDALWKAERERNVSIYAKWEGEYGRWRARNPTAPFDDFVSCPVSTAHDAAIDREDVFLNAKDEAAEQIREISAKTLAGLAVKARLARDEFNSILKIIRPTLDAREREGVLSLFREVERMAEEAAHV